MVACMCWERGMPVPDGLKVQQVVLDQAWHIGWLKHPVMPKLLEHELLMLVEDLPGLDTLPQPKVNEVQQALAESGLALKVCRRP